MAFDQKKYLKEWRASNPEKVKEYARRHRERNPGYGRKYWNPEVGRKSKLASRYGLTIQEYEEMLEEQGGACAACGAKPTRTRLAVDHCHSTGRIRGLLCAGCNRTLGILENRPGLKEYFDRHTKIVSS